MIKIKVLHVISNNDYGGGAAYVLNICKAPHYMLDNFLCCIGEGPLYEMAKENHINVMKLNVKNILISGLTNIIKTNSIDIVNFHGAKANFIYSFIKKNISVPAVVTIHSDYRYDFINNKLKHLFFTPLSIIGLKSFENYVCVSNHILNIIESNDFAGNKAVIENGIEIINYEPEIDRAKIRELYKINNNDFVFTMVARMHPIKNHRSLLSAFKRLRAELSNIKLMLIGDGTLIETLKEEAIKENLQSDVIFTGFKRNSLDYLNACDISILTSYSEGGSPPLVILESGLVKKTIICSNIGDMSDIIKEELGYLIDPNSVEDIYSKMKEAYFNKDKLNIMGNELNKIVCKDYSIERFWEKYYNFYNDILQKIN